MNCNVSVLLESKVFSCPRITLRWVSLISEQEMENPEWTLNSDHHRTPEEIKGITVSPCTTCSISICCLATHKA